jgi:hypothetical protein
MDKIILDYLANAEGTTVHRNSTETDITSPYGIYRAVHPKASIFGYIDSIAKSIGVVSQSKDLDKSTIDKINLKLDNAKVLAYADEFYNTYLAGAKLELFKDEAKIAMLSMYTNSNTGAWIAVQRAIISLVKSKQIPLELSQVSIDDGKFGGKTQNALTLIKQHNYISGYHFESLILFYMTTYYVELWKKNPQKYGIYLDGWKNRMAKLQEIR